MPVKLDVQAIMPAFCSRGKKVNAFVADRPRSCYLQWNKPNPDST